MNLLKTNNLRRQRQRRVGFKLSKNNHSKKKRIFLMISNKHIYAQLMDTTTGKTITSVSTQDQAFKAEKRSLANKLIAEKLAEIFYHKVSKNLKNPQEEYYFDRGKRLYHGRVRVFADTLRKKGMKL